MVCLVVRGIYSQAIISLDREASNEAKIPLGQPHLKPYPLLLSVRLAVRRGGQGGEAGGVGLGGGGGGGGRRHRGGRGGGPAQREEPDGDRDGDEDQANAHGAQAHQQRGGRIIGAED